MGNLLEQKGYEIRVLDLISMEKSHCYNPFVYLHSDNDVQRLVTNLFKSTTPKGSQSQDPFWDTSSSMLLSALVYYLHYEAPDDEQNFAMVMEMLQAAAIDNEEDPRPSPLDCLFDDLELDRPDHIALKYYRSYHTGSAKTLKSIQITLAARLEKFNLESLAALTCTPDFLKQKKIKNYGDMEYVQVQGTHEPIVTVEEYEQVQKLMDAKSVVLKNHKKGKRRTGRQPHSTAYGRLMMCQCGNKFNLRFHSRDGRTDGVDYLKASGLSV